MSRITDMGVYAIENTVSGRVYVGSSVKLTQRLANHEADMRRGYHPSQRLSAELQEHGFDAFRFMVLQRSLEELELDYLEDLWARRLLAYRSQGYNAYAPSRVSKETPTDEEYRTFEEEFTKADNGVMSDMELGRYLTIIELMRPNGGRKWSAQRVQEARHSIQRRQKKRAEKTEQND